MAFFVEYAYRFNAEERFLWALNRPLAVLWVFPSFRRSGMGIATMSKPLTPTEVVQSPAATAKSSHSGRSLGVRVAIRLFWGFIIMAAILFIPAGTWKFWQAWAFLFVIFIPLVFIFLYFLRHEPQRVQGRLKIREQEPEQRELIRLAVPFFVVVFLLPGLDHRMGWSHTLLVAVPLWLTLVSDALVLGSLLLIGWVIKVNKYAIRTIHVLPGQTVISIGPYCLVRHPLYSGSVVMWLFTPLALGSLLALPAFALLVPFFVLRLLNEEKTLRKHLRGYTAYCHRTPFRLIPFIW
jgi:protein-S-isoprenylcysteine O-methyltransferase Ste14